MGNCRYYTPTNKENGRCKLIEDGLFSKEYPIISQRYQELHKGRYFLPNGECSWIYEERPSCPFFEEDKNH